MAEDLRHRGRFAASLTICGLMADLGYILVEAAARFSLDRRWPEAAAYFIVGSVATAVAATRALARVERNVGRGLRPPPSAQEEPLMTLIRHNPPCSDPGCMPCWWDALDREMYSFNEPASLPPEASALPEEETT